MDDDIRLQLNNRNREICILREKIEERNVIIKQLKRQIIFMTESPVLTEEILAERQPRNFKKYLIGLLIYTVFIFFTAYFIMKNIKSE